MWLSWCELVRAKKKIRLIVMIPMDNKVFPVQRCELSCQLLTCQIVQKGYVKVVVYIDGEQGRS